MKISAKLLAYSFVMFVSATQVSSAFELKCSSKSENAQIKITLKSNDEHKSAPVAGTLKASTPHGSINEVISVNLTPDQKEQLQFMTAYGNLGEINGAEINAPHSSFKTLINIFVQKRADSGQRAHVYYKETALKIALFNQVYTLVCNED